MITAAVAQQAAASPAWKFRSLNQLGLLQGENGSAFHLQTVNGIAHRQYFIGLGTGLDYYQFKSIPLFAEGIRYFGKTNGQFFMYAGAGLNFAWEKTNTGFSNPSNYTEKYPPGFYGNAGIGYKAGFKNGIGLLLSAGYNYKRINYVEKHTLCAADGSCNLKDTYQYNLQRLLIQIGWMF